MAESTGQERSELATSRKRQQARERGNVARSMEVSSVVVFVASLLGLHHFMPQMAETAAGLFRRAILSLPNLELTPDTVLPGATAIARIFAVLVLPFAGLVAGASILSQVVQVGPLFTLQPLQPKWERISPIAGFKRIVSKRSVVELVKSLVKIGIVGALLVGALIDAPTRLLALATADLSGAYALIFGLLLRMGGAAAAALAILAILDVLFQRWDYEKQLMMTRQEVKQENKETEGDPLVKSFLRSMQREVGRRRMMEGVKKADVVVTNPIHFAVALRYDPSNMAAPKVIAKGARLVAKRIREIAVAAGVPVIEDPPLARALHKSCRIGSQVPLSLYRAVADLLAFVYRQRGRRVTSEVTS